jgi:8-oxo-dGTP diphosphatase
MKYINNREKNIQYKKRPGSYAIIIRKDDNKIGIVTNGNDNFYLGGGIEKNETELEALKRELIEESGYTITNIQEFDSVGSFIFAEEHGYLEVIANVYIAEFDEKVTEPIEKDHVVLWVNAKDYVGKMCREWQEYILKEFIRRFGNEIEK